MPIRVEIAENSYAGQTGYRMTSILATYPRWFHAECKTHRRVRIGDRVVDLEQEVSLMDDPKLSRNASSSRAIPIKRLIREAMENPAVPEHWGAHQKGMQAAGELEGRALEEVKAAWFAARDAAVEQAQRMADAGAAKQLVNRLLEPYTHITVIISATDWANFFALRRHPDAEPHIQKLADAIHLAQFASVPRVLWPGEWHLPFVSSEEIEVHGGRTDPTGKLRRISAARCARTSYLTHDGRRSSIEEDLALCERLATSELVHASPFEHQATPDTLITNGEGKPARWENPRLHGNLTGWVQHRHLIPNNTIEG